MRLSGIHYFFAHGVRLATWGTALFSVVAVIWHCPPTLALLGNAEYMCPLIVSLLAAAPLGWILGAIFLWPVFFAVGSKVNGAPFEEGDLVRILVGPHRGEVVRVYEVWEERNQVCVDLGGRAKTEATDVFNYTEVCRERKPED